VKHTTIVMALTCLLTTMCSVQAWGDGFKFPKISNPFRQPTVSDSSELLPGPRVTGSNPMPLRFFALDISKRAWGSAFSLNSRDLAGRFGQLA
jgi:hypothetical protein